MRDQERTDGPGVPASDERPDNLQTRLPGTEAGPQETTPPPPGKQSRAVSRTLLAWLGVAVLLIIAVLIGIAFFSPQRAATGDTVSVYFTGMDENGSVFDSNMNGTEPFVFTIGNSTIIPGFQHAVIGMAVHDEKTVSVPVDQAYGPYNPKLIVTVNRSGPIANTTFIEGNSYYIHDKTRNAYTRIRVINVTGTTVTWDANSPLAGENLTFTIKLAGVTKGPQPANVTG